MIYEIIKRLMDIILGIILTVIFFPICLLAAIAIKLESPGPLFVEKSTRVGKDGERFFMYKFRTMIPNAREKLASDPQFRKLYRQYKKNSYKLKNDPRVTRVGRFLRRYSLDELPQMINVLKGEMSLVGPRAYYPDELERQQRVYPQTQKYVKILLSAKPGITGYWQVSGRSEINFDQRVKMDAEYVQKRSILYDFWIVFRTPWAMITGKGAV